MSRSCLPAWMDRRGTYVDDDISAFSRKRRHGFQDAFALSDGELRALNERLAYLEEAAGRLGRVDWRNAAVGAMFGTALAAALPPDVVRTVVLTLLQCVGHLLGLGLPPG